MGSKVVPMNTNPLERAREAKAREIYEEFSRVYRNIPPQLQEWAIEGLNIAMEDQVVGDHLALYIREMVKKSEESLEPHEQTDRRDLSRLCGVLEKLDREMALRMVRMQADQAHGVIAADPEDSGPEMFTVQDLLAMPPVQWLVSGWIPEKSLTVLYGAPGSYKSFIALDIALSVAMGIHWKGINTERGRVIYHAAEGAAGIPQRLLAWQTENWPGPLPPDLPFHLIGGKMKGGKYKYSNPQDVDSIIHFLKHQGVNQLSLYIVDTMRQSMDGSDSSDQDVQNFLDGVARIQQEFQCAIMVVHHMGKDKSKGMRGSTALEGAADSVIYADKVSEEFLALSNQKQKDGKDGKEMNVKAELVPIEMHGQSLTVPVMVMTEHQGRIPRDNDTLNKLLAALEGNEKGLSVTGLADRAGVSRQTVHNYRKQLEDLGVTVEIKGNRTLFYPVNPSL